MSTIGYDAAPYLVMALPETSNALACPSLEEIAAFIDGRLQAAGRAQLVEHLADCEDCRVLVAETALLLQEVAPENETAGEAPVVAFPGRRRRMVRTLLPLAAAAVLVLTIGPGIYRRFLQPASFASISRNLEQMDAAKLAPHLKQQEVVRSGGNSPDFKSSESAFRVGVQSVNLKVSLAAGQQEEARKSVLDLLSVFEAETFAPSSIGFYKGLEQELRDPSSPAALSQKAEAARRAARELEPSFDETYLLFGQWAATGQLAAAVQDPAFFQQRGNRRFLDQILKGEGLESDERAHLEQIRKTWDKGHLGGQDFRDLQESFSGIIEPYLRIH